MPAICAILEMNQIRNWPRTIDSSVQILQKRKRKYSRCKLNSYRSKNYSRCKLCTNWLKKYTFEMQEKVNRVRFFINAVRFPKKLFTYSIFRSARASCTTSGGPVRTPVRAKNLDTYIQAYMPHESSEDSSNQPIGHMGSPRRLP